MKSASDINAAIIKQGDIVRDLKAQKADKAQIDTAVKALLALKVDYKNLTQTDWKPGCVPPSAINTPTTIPVLNSSGDDDLNAQIAAQGDKVK